MRSRTFQSVVDFRERFFGAPREQVGRLAGISAERMVALEESDDPTMFELEHLAAVYGVDPDTLLDRPIRIRAGDSIQVLALMEEFQALDAATKSRISAAAAAARDVIGLREVLEGKRVDPRREFTTAVKPMHIPKRNQGVAHEEGRWLAGELRRRLGLGFGPVASMRDLLADAFPQITLLYARLGRDRISGLSFSDAVRGPAIVLNLDGKNCNPCVRRFSLAHELCHLLHDWNRQQPLATLSGFHDERALHAEQRANAFAVHFLCPQRHVRAVSDAEDPQRAIQTLMRKFGLHFRACKLAVENEAGIRLPSGTWTAVDPSVSPEWTRAESPCGLEGFPIAEVPPERRTRVAELAARAYADGRLQRDRFAGYLGVTPTHDVESVLDYFALDQPSA